MPCDWPGFWNLFPPPPEGGGNSKINELPPIKNGGDK